MKLNFRPSRTKQIWRLEQRRLSLISPSMRPTRNATLHLQNDNLGPPVRRTPHSAPHRDDDHRDRPPVQHHVRRVARSQRRRHMTDPRPRNRPWLQLQARQVASHERGHHRRRQPANVSEPTQVRPRQSRRRHFSM